MKGGLLEGYASTEKLDELDTKVKLNLIFLVLREHSLVVTKPKILLVLFCHQDPSNGGGNYGGVTVSLHTVDLAKLFVDVQKSILENTSGMNCTCGENLLTEENITNATIQIVQAQAEQQVKRKRLLEKKKRLLRNSRIPKVLKY